MAVEDIVRPTREASFTYENNDKTEEFIIREPTPDEMNMCDIFRSKIWYDCMKEGIATEEEILEMLKNQGRFNNDKYNEKLEELNQLSSIALQEMAGAESLEDLENKYKEAAQCRENTIKHMQKRSAFTRHSVEVRADHAYNMSLMGLCIEKRNGKEVFIVRDELGNVDVEKTFKKTEGWPDVTFINTALSHFLPFIMGFENGKTKYAEDFVFDTISARFKRTEEPKSEEINDDLEENLELNSNEVISEDPIKEEIKTKIEAPEVTIEIPKVEEKESDPLDMEVDNFSPNVMDEPKPELTKANNRPRMTPAPTSERMTVKGGQRAPEEDTQIDPTEERAGFRTGDEDASYGDGSATPGGAPMRTILNRE